MKLFYGINISKHKANTELDGEVFICERTSDAQTDLMDKSYENLTEIDKKAKLPRPVRLLQYACGYLSLIIAFIALQSVETKEDFLQLLAKWPWLFAVTIILVVVWGILTYMSLKKSKSVYESDESKMLYDRHDSAIKNAVSALGVPPTAKHIDCLLAFYKVTKSGEIKIKPNFSARFSNLAYIHAFAENGILYLANPHLKHAIPLSEIKAIKAINKRTTMNGWNKETPFNKGEYKPYKIMLDNRGVFHLRRYYALEIIHNGEVYLLYFPPYELPAFTELTGLTPQED